MGPPGEEGLRGKACDAGQADARYSHRRLGDRGSFEASGRVDGVAEEARTRGFAAPAFAGCAFVVGW